VKLRKVEAYGLRLAEMDMTAQELFRGTDIYPEYLASFVTCPDQSKRKDIRLSTLTKIARTLELKTSELIALAEKYGESHEKKD
jgi:DNA-binding Xre family transcriptional regulator